MSVSDYYDVPWDWPLIQTATLAQDLKAYAEAINERIIDRDQITRDVFNKDPEEVAHKCAKVAARDAAYGFNETPVATLKEGGSVVPPWSPTTPLAKAVLAEVTGDEDHGVAPVATPVDGFPAV